MKKPILFLIFNRPDTTKQVFEAIREHQPKQLFIAADGPRKNKDGEKQLCEETRSVIRNIDWDCEVKTLFRDENLGCKDAVSSAITWFFDHVEDGIILEDDCLPTPAFFDFCAEHLDKYRDNPKIMHIGGNNFQFGKTNIEDDYYFSIITHIWGWATWKDRWRMFDIEMNNLDNFIENKEIEKYFDKTENQNYWLDAFKKVQEGGLNSWGYIWSYTVMNQDGLAIIPSKNLVENIGFSGEATHTKNKPKYIDKFNQEAKENFHFKITKHPKRVCQNKYLDQIYFKNIGSNPIKNIIKLVLKKIGLFDVIKKFYLSLNKR